MNVRHHRRGRSGNSRIDHLLARAALEALEPRQLLSFTDFTPTDDAYVRGGAYADQHFGSSIELVTKTASADGTRRAFLKYSLDQIGTDIDGGKMRLYGYLADTVSSTVTVSVYPVSDLTWDEDLITWNTQPAYDSSTVLAQQVIDNFGDSNARWYEFDVAGYVEQQKALGRTAISLMLKAEGSNTARVVFNSEEAAANKNVLRIEDNPPGAGANEPVADAYVRGGAYANDEFGTATTLAIKDDPSADFDRESYLRFDLGTTPISSAKLNVFGNLGSGTTPPTIGVFAVPDTSWSETAINWNNKPASSGSALSTVTVSGSTAQWYEFDVTNYAEQQRLAGATAISLVLKPTTGTNRVDLSSREATVGRPQLVIESAAPSAPGDLAAQANGSTVIDLSWTDTSANETGFEVQQSPDGVNGWTTIATPGVNATSQAVSALTPATTYHFRVRAVNASGSSAWAGPAQATTGQPTTPPASPTNLTVSGLSTTSVTLGWTDGSLETSYRIQRATNSTFTQNLATFSASANSTAYSDVTAASKWKYFYRVVATNSAGDSSPAVIGPVVPSEPSGDEDHDTLTNLAEANTGTDPLLYDTDGDLLGDGWETRYASYGRFDPLQADPSLDPDGDGLDDDRESVMGTDPGNADTDGDGSTDNQENGNSDPTDPNDLPKAMAFDMTAGVDFVIGDHTAGPTEYWGNSVGIFNYYIGRTVSFWRAPLIRGQSYPITVTHMGTSRSNGPDYDYRLDPDDSPTTNGWFFTDDNTPPLIQPSGVNDVNPTGKVAHIHLPLLDADVDSDNADGFSVPVDNLAEDILEDDEQGRTPKLLAPNTGDIDNDGITDIDDLQIDGGQFVPLVVRLSANTALAGVSGLQLSFTYDTTKLRLWNQKDASQARTPADVIASGSPVPATSFLAPGGYAVFFMEGLAAASDLLKVVVQAQVASQKWTGVLNDDVAVQPVVAELDVNNDGKIEGAPDGVKNYLPGYSGEDAVLTPAAPQQMKIIVPGVKQGMQVQFELEGTTNLPGVASNVDGTVAAKDAADFELVGANAGVATAVADAKGNAVVGIICRDFGGRTTVKITVGQDVRRLQIPLDQDNDTLPDVWEAQQSGFDKTKAQTTAGVDDKSRDADKNRGGADGAATGDLLPAFDEYRGFFVVDGENEKHVRTNPMTKNVFLCDELIYEITDGGESILSMFSKADVIWYEVKKTAHTDADRHINFNGSTEQRAVFLESSEETGDGPGLTNGPVTGIKPSNYVFVRVNTTFYKHSVKLLNAVDENNQPFVFYDGTSDAYPTATWQDNGRVKIGDEIIQYERGTPPGSRLGGSATSSIAIPANLPNVFVSTVENYPQFAVGSEVIKPGGAYPRSTGTVKAIAAGDTSIKTNLTLISTPATGSGHVLFAKIGSGDTAEWISYTGIVEEDGSYTLTGVTRGLLGTIARDHAVGRSLDSPAQYAGCARGAFGTTAAAIPIGTSVKPIGVFENVTRGKAGTTAAAHAEGADVRAYTTDDAVRRTAAHEAGHAIGMVAHRPNSIMESPIRRGQFLGNGVVDDFLDASQEEIDTR